MQAEANPKSLPLGYPIRHIAEYYLEAFQRRWDNGELNKRDFKSVDIQPLGLMKY